MLVSSSKAYTGPSECLWFSLYLFSVGAIAPPVRAVVVYQQLANVSVCPCTEADLSPREPAPAKPLYPLHSLQQWDL